jgi:hypothetical protein
MTPIHMKPRIFPILLNLIILAQSYVLAGDPEIRSGMGEPPMSLFHSDEPLYLTLSMDLEAVFSNREAEDYHRAEISYINAAGEKINVPLKICVRGDFRKDYKNCDFPPLRLNFEDTTVMNTIFEGQDKIKLVTHCRSKLNLYEQNVLKEYLAYKLYNLVSDVSYAVRLVQMTYADVKGKFDTLQKMSFLIEPTGQMARRNGCSKLKISNIHQTRTNQEKTDVMAVFQYMIGNTDWSVWAQHNIILLKEDTSTVPVAVPYDFDWAGLVNPPYAVPAEFLPIENVRIRLYRGFCKSDEELQPALEAFRKHKDDIYQTCNSTPYMSPNELKRTLKYMDGFFKVIENPKKVESEFHRKCRTTE